MRKEHVRLQSALKDIDQHVADALEAISNRPLHEILADKTATAAVAFHGIIIGEAAARALSAGHHIENADLVNLLERARSARNEFVHEYDVVEPDNMLATVA